MYLFSAKLIVDLDLLFIFAIVVFCQFNLIEFCFLECNTKGLFMQKSGLLYDLKYLNEHMSCSHYIMDVQTGFRYVEFKLGDVFNYEQITHNYIILVLSGSIEVKSDVYKNMFSADEMVLLRNGSSFSMDALSDCSVLFFGFQLPMNVCDRYELNSYWKKGNEIVYKFEPLPMKPPMRGFADLLVYCLKNGVNCAHFHELKHKEFFLLLRYFYTREEAIRLLQPIVSTNLDFKNTILRHYNDTDQGETLAYLMDKTNLCRTSFFKQFKKEFGMTSKQWLNKQLVQKISQLAMDPKMNPHSIMYETHFSSYPGFYKFVKKYFGCLPNQLTKVVEDRAGASRENKGLPIL